jgi:hypothetical protein
VSVDGGHLYAVKMANGVVADEPPIEFHGDSTAAVLQTFKDQVRPPAGSVRIVWAGRQRFALDRIDAATTLPEAIRAHLDTNKVSIPRLGGTGDMLVTGVAAPTDGVAPVKKRLSMFGALSDDLAPVWRAFGAKTPLLPSAAAVLLSGVGHGNYLYVGWDIFEFFIIHNGVVAQAAQGEGLSALAGAVGGSERLAAWAAGEAIPRPAAAQLDRFASNVANVARFHLDSWRSEDARGPDMAYRRDSDTRVVSVFGPGLFRETFEKALGFHNLIMRDCPPPPAVRVTPRVDTARNFLPIAVAALDLADPKAATATFIDPRAAQAEAREEARRRHRQNWLIAGAGAAVTAAVVVGLPVQAMVSKMSAQNAYHAAARQLAANGHDARVWSAVGVGGNDIAQTRQSAYNWQDIAAMVTNAGQAGASASVTGTTFTASTAGVSATATFTFPGGTPFSAVAQLISALEAEGVQDVNPSGFSQTGTNQTVSLSFFVPATVKGVLNPAKGNS